jgi:hypothetical protein
MAAIGQLFIIPGAVVLGGLGWLLSKLILGEFSE